MLIVKGFKTEIDPTPAQADILRNYAEAARFAYNWGRWQCKQNYAAWLSRKMEAEAKGDKLDKSDHSTLSFYDLTKRLNVVKDAEFPWMREVPYQVPARALESLAMAFQHFFRRCKERHGGNGNGKLGFPHYHEKPSETGQCSFVIGCPIHVENHQFRLPEPAKGTRKLGSVRLKERGYLPEDNKRAAVSYRAGRWFLSVQAEVSIPDVEAAGEPVGVDVGISHLATVSDGRTFPNPKAAYGLQRKLRLWERRKSRRKPGGSGRKEAVEQVSKYHWRVANVRADATHAASSAILAMKTEADKRPSAVGIETLNIKGMVKNKHLARAIHDANMSTLARQLEYKAAWQGTEVVKAGTYYPSTKTCSSCGVVKETMKLSERVFVCEDCGLVLDRDVNAARNLAALARTAKNAGTNAPGEELTRRILSDALVEGGTLPLDVVQVAAVQEVSSGCN